MIAYILSNVDLAVKDVIEYDKPDIKENIDYDEKSTIIVGRKPNVTDDDFVICKDKNDILFIGICETFNGSSDTAGYTITLRQKEYLFDRDIFLTNEQKISQNGIEDFIVSAITSNWKSTGDSLLDKTYITATAVTHTPKNIKVELNNGVYNLKTFLGNAKELYHVYLDYDFSTAGELLISVSVKQEAVLPIDITISDISDYDEIYNVDVLAKLNVKWKIPDEKDSTGVITHIGATTYRYFYLLNNRTISENGSDPRRVAGVQKSVYIETDKEAEMIQQAQNAFTSNTYEHKISFNIKKDSRTYTAAELYVGRECNIRTQTGVRASIITKAERSKESPTIALTFGGLKVDLTEKLRGMKR